MRIQIGENAAKKLLCLALILIGFLWPRPLRAADKITLSADLSSSFLNSKSHSITGERSVSESELYSQQYRLFFENEIYPLWKLRGGGLFERSHVNLKEDGIKSDATATRKNPFIDTLLGSTLLNASAGFNRREDEAKGSNQPSTKRFRDNYTGSLNYKPYDLPSLNLRLTRTNTYDGNHTDMDTTLDRLLVGSRYRPVETVELIYSGQRNTNNNHLDNVETINTTHSGRVSYGDQFFNNRLNVSSTYSISHRSDELRAGQEGEVETDLTTEIDFYLYGLDKDKDPAEDEVGTDPGQLNRTRTPISVGAGIDIGNQGGLDSWNIGLEFTLDTELNLLRIFVSVPVGSPTQDLSEIAGSFTWDVYTSDAIENDGVNDIIKWTSLASGLTASYDTFTNSFDIRFPRVNNRFIKVVVAPLENNTDPRFNHIYVSGLTPLLVQPVADVKRKSWRLTHLYNMSALARLLENPGLNYNFTLFYTETRPTDSSRFSMSNGLSLRHEFTDWLRGNARVSRDDSRQRPSDDEQIFYRYSAGLNATPLPTLTHNLTYSGQHETTNGETTVRDTFSLYNRAALYQGIDLLLGGSFSFGSQPGNQDTKSRLINYGLALKPHRVLRMDLIGSTTRAELSRPGEPDRISTRESNRFSLSYNPLTTLNFFLALEEVKRNDDRNTLKTYSASWSPLWGALMCNLSYTETQRPEDDSFSKTWSASLRWEIRPATNLDLSYTDNESHNSTQDTTSDILNISLKARF